MQDPTSANATETDHQHRPPPPPSKRSNRRKRHGSKVLPGQITLRLVCHSSIVGDLIGNSRSIVSQLRRETGCKIHCEDSVAGTEDRVILVIGSLSPRKGLALGDGEVEVSNAQEAAVRVFERVWELEAEKGVNSNRGINGEVFGKLLAHTSQIGVVFGKGGKNVSTIRNNSGANIRVFRPPNCAAKDEKLVLITGEGLAVKKALIAVSHYLQGCPPLVKVPVSSSTPTISSSDRSTSDPHEELFPHLNSWLPSMEGLSINDASKRTTNSNGNSSLDLKGTEHEVVFRILCSNNVVWSVIGKKGAVVRALESKTGAFIIFAGSLGRFEELIVTISAMENVESSYSPAQDAVILVFARIVEDHIRKGFLPVSSVESPVTARLLVASSNVDCLTGIEGQVISELREVTGADIQILHGEAVPNGASDNDVVVQITGGYKCVQNVLYRITCRIRDNLLHNELPAETRMKFSPQVNKDTVKGKFFPKRKSAFPSRRLAQKNAGVNAETVTENGELHTNLSENLEHGRKSAFPSWRLARKNAGVNAETVTENGELHTNLSENLEHGRKSAFPSRRLARKNAGVNAETVTENGELHTNLSETLEHGRKSAFPSRRLARKNAGVNAETVTENGELHTNLSENLEHGRGNMLATVTSTTVEIVVSEHVFGSVYGEDGGNLDRIRQISGASVTVYDPCVGKSGGKVVICGTPDQTFAAQSLL